MYLDSLRSGPHSDVAYAVVAGVARGSRILLSVYGSLQRSGVIQSFRTSILTTKNSMHSFQSVVTVT